MKFLIQENLISERNLDQIRKAIGDLPRQYCKVIPFSSEIITEEPLEGLDYIPYGSCNLVNQSVERGFVGVHMDLANFNYLRSSMRRGDMLNDSGKILRIDAAIEYLEEQPRWSRWFLRPNEDLKLFSGEEMDKSDAIRFLKGAILGESSINQRMTGDTLILVAPPLRIDMEWRWFIVDGKIISGSVYRMDGRAFLQRETDQTVIDEAQALADIWLPDKCCVMDTALINATTEDATIKVVEFNCINGSGFYDHDVDAILRSLYKYHTQ